MLGVVGSLALDLVDGAPPRPGGAVFYAAQALRLLGTRASILTRCAPGDRDILLPGLAGDSLSVEWIPAAATATFSFSYDGDARRMAVEEVGDPWRPEDVQGRLEGVEWIHVAGLLRSDFAAETLAVLARGRKVLLAGHALVRRGEKGPLRLDSEFDPRLLDAVDILALSEEEAKLVPVPSLDVAEVLVTLASRGSIVHTAEESERIEIDPVEGADPTGAGDAFALCYLAARSAGATPFDAARSASDVTSNLLAGR